MADEVAQQSDLESAQDGQPGLPDQAEVFRMPRRFGHVPVDEAPLGWDTERRFEAVYPRVELPFQEVERIPFGHPELEPNQLFFGDNLHIMRMLPSESIDLIYIDPPFFSGRNYNLLFGDKSELRSFEDVWEGGLTGYLVWLNARLYEMKRLLKETGAIFVHLDWHAAHYVKVEMDKIFGYENFRNEIIWHYKFRMMQSDRIFNRKHDTILFYAKSPEMSLRRVVEEWTREEIIRVRKQAIHTDDDGREWVWMPGPRGRSKNKKKYLEEIMAEGKALSDVWDMPIITSSAKERIGYPTQKPEALLERILEASSAEGEVVADFFCGGGTTPAVAQRLARRWIASDVSRVAVSITADRIAKIGEGAERETQTTLEETPDFLLLNWGTYESDRLTELGDEAFREFVVKAFGGRLATAGAEIHGYKSEPLFVGSSKQDDPIGIEQVRDFAKAVLARSEGDEARGTMLGWAFTREAQLAAERLLAQRQATLRFVRLKLVALESPEYKAHVVERSPQYAHLLTFVLPPAVRFTAERVAPKTYRFDASESQSLNAGGGIINVQWDFDYRAYFTSSAGFEFARKRDVLALDAEYEFPRNGTWRVACRMQDDVGGQATSIQEIEVS